MGAAVSIKTFIDWLYDTPFSSFIRDTDGLIAFVQSVHILAIAAVFGSALAIELRILRWFGTEASLSIIARRFLPWLWWSLLLLLTTGLIMILGEPDRTLANGVFWSKMGLVLLATGLTFWLRRPLMEAEAAPPARWQGLALTVIWVAVIFCGRWIAYAGGV